MKSDLIDLACELRHETPKAWLVNDGTKDVWLPKSQCEYANGVITMPEWLAKEKELI